MTKASSSFLLFVIFVFLTSISSFAQSYYNDRQIYEVPLKQHLSGFQKLNLGQVLKLSPEGHYARELISITLIAQSRGRHSSRIELLEFGRLIDTQPAPRFAAEVSFNLNGGMRPEQLEISSPTGVYIDSVRAEFKSLRNPHDYSYGRQPLPFSVLSLQIGQNFRRQGFLNLLDILNRQHQISLEGTQIEKITITGHPLGYGAAGVELQLNNQTTGTLGHISYSNQFIELFPTSPGPIFSLGLGLYGDVHIHEVRIHIGQIRSDYNQGPRTERFQVKRRISPELPIDLARMIGDQQRPIRAITIEARSQGRGSAQLRLMTRFGQFQGSINIGNHPIRATLPLKGQIHPQELIFEVTSNVIIESLEVEYGGYSRY